MKMTTLIILISVFLALTTGCQFSIPEVTSLPEVPKQTQPTPTITNPTLTSTATTPTNQPSQQQDQGYVTLELSPVAKGPSLGYTFHAVMQEHNGYDVDFGVLTFEFIHTDRYYIHARDWMNDHIGTSIVTANGTLEWSFDYEISEALDYFNQYEEVILRVALMGSDSEGNLVICYDSISTKDFR